MSTKGTPIVIELPEDFEDSDDFETELDKYHSNIDSDNLRDPEDTHYFDLIGNLNDSYEYESEQSFLDAFLSAFEKRIQSCTIETKDKRKYDLIPKFTITKVNPFFEKPCTLVFSFFKDTQGYLNLTMSALRSGHEIKKVENKPLNEETMNALLDYLEHDFVPAYFLPTDHSCFPLGLARNLFGYAFSFLDPSTYEIKKTELGFDLIPYGKFKYVDRTIHFSFWTRTEDEKLRYILIDSEESIKSTLNLPTDLNLELYIHRFKVEITDTIRDKIIVDIAAIFDFWTLEHYLEYLGAVLPRYIPKLSTDQKNFLNALCKLYSEIKDVDKELRKKLELLIEKAFTRRDYTEEEKQMASQIYKQYRDWGYVWKSME